jgi:hypothetical protein
MKTYMGFASEIDWVGNPHPRNSLAVLKGQILANTPALCVHLETCFVLLGHKEYIS